MGASDGEFILEVIRTLNVLEGLSPKKGWGSFEGWIGEEGARVRKTVKGTASTLSACLHRDRLCWLSRCWRDTEIDVAHRGLREEAGDARTDLQLVRREGYECPAWNVVGSSGKAGWGPTKEEQSEQSLSPRR